MSINSAGRWLLLPLSMVVLADSRAWAGDVPHPETLAARIDELFESCNRPDLPGCAVGIVHDGKLIYRKGFGTANLDYGAPNTPQTIFERLGLESLHVSLHRPLDG